MGGREETLNSGDSKASRVEQSNWVVNKLQFFVVPMERGLEMIKGFNNANGQYPTLPKGHTTQF
jgi:hypothetical protein